MAHATVELECKGCTFDVVIEADVLEGGSNSHGSDEPEWVEVGTVSYTRPDTGKSLSKRLIKLIEHDHYEYVTDKLIEESQEW